MNGALFILLLGGGSITPQAMLLSPALSQPGLHASFHVTPSAMTLGPVLATPGLHKTANVTPASMTLAPILTRTTLTGPGAVTPSTMTLGPALQQTRLSARSRVTPAAMLLTPDVTQARLSAATRMTPAAMALAPKLDAVALARIALHFTPSTARSRIVGGAGLLTLIAYPYGASLDYPIVYALDDGDAIVTSAWTITPVEDGGLSMIDGSDQIDGATTACLFTGGLLGRVYEARNTVQTQAGRSLVETLAFRIVEDFPA